MALVSDEVLSSKNDEVASSSSDGNVPLENEEVEHIDMSLATTTDEEEEKQASTSTPIEPQLSTSSSISSDEITNTKRQNRSKLRSVSFAPTVEEFLIPARSSCPSNPASVDYIDALVESYKLQTSNYLFSVEEEEKKYIPKTTRTRLNPNWREHRTRHLMNKLEELSLWDREEELKATHAQYLREQRLEQIQDRQRNNNLCLNLMRQRHESEIESALLLDRIASSINDDNTKGTIARTMNLASSPGNILAYDLPIPSHKVKRHVRHELSSVKTPAGRYRQFETKMNTKLEKINEKLQPDREIMRAYSPYRTIPPTFVPLFSETYSSLLSLADTYSSNRYHYGAAKHLHQPQHASSPDYETRHRSSSTRDVRVPLKEQANNINYDDDNDDYNHSKMNSNPSRRPTNIISSTATSLYDCSTVSNTPREHSYLHSRQPISNNINHRSLNDDLNAITNFSLETSKSILHSISDSPTRSSPSKSTNKRVMFADQDNNEENFNYNNSSKMTIST